MARAWGEALIPSALSQPMSDAVGSCPLASSSYSEDPGPLVFKTLPSLSPGLMACGPQREDSKIKPGSCTPGEVRDHLFLPSSMVGTGGILTELQRDVTSGC